MPSRTCSRSRTATETLRCGSFSIYTIKDLSPAADRTACPHVPGAAAQAVADGASSRRGVRSALTDNTEALGLGENESGAGFLDVAAILDHDPSDDGTGEGSRDDGGGLFG